MRIGLFGLGRIGAFHAATLSKLPAVDSLVVRPDPILGQAHGRPVRRGNRRPPRGRSHRVADTGVQIGYPRRFDAGFAGARGRRLRRTRLAAHRALDDAGSRAATASLGRRVRRHNPRGNDVRRELDPLAVRAPPGAARRGSPMNGQAREPRRRVWPVFRWPALCRMAG